MRDMFEQTWCVYAMSIGISYDSFWHMNPHIVMLYQKAHEDKLREQNMLMYIQGLYMREAIASTIGNAFRGNQKAFEYPKAPYELFGEQKSVDMTYYDENRTYTEEEERANAENVFAWLGGMQQKFEKSHKKTDTDK